MTETWNYVSPTSISISGDLTTKYWANQRVKFVQNAVTKYFVIKSVTYGSPNTVIVLKPITDNVVEDLTITNQHVSWLDAPRSFPYDSSGKGAYSVIVYIDNTDIIAEDSEGTTIDSGTAGTDDSTMIQAASQNPGYVFLKKSATNFVITSGVTPVNGAFLISDGATLDISSFDGVAFNWGSDAVYAENKFNMGGLEGFYILGDQEKTNSWIAKASNMPRGLRFENLVLHDIYNGFDIRGASYDALLKNINSITFQGTMFQFTQLDNGPGYGPNNAHVTGCELSCGGANTGFAVKILASTTETSVGYCPDGVVIEDNWFESMQTCIINQGWRTSIINNPRIYTSYGASASHVPILVQAKIITATPVAHSGTDTKIINNLIYAVGAYNKISISAQWSNQYIYDNQIFGDGLGNGIISDSTIYPEICRNEISGQAIGIYLSAQFSKICQNDITIPSGMVGIGGTYSDDLEITDNIFSGASGASNIVNSNLSASRILRNTFTANPVVTVDPTCVIKYNTNYITEKTGTSTGTGTEQTIAHTLTGAPTKVIITPSVTSAAMSNMYANASSIIVTVTSGKAYTWSAEV
jgi:hypothetical protein